MKVLELDSGNTRLKWRVRDNQQTHKQGVLLNTEDWQIGIQSILTEVGDIHRARASVVSGSDRAESLASIIRSVFGVKLQLLKVYPVWSGLQLHYDNPLKLGIDRWLAMLTAWNHPFNGARIVVDSGTALTLDIINDMGHHQGGFIVPGQTLLKKSLLTNTAHLSISYEPTESIDPGRKTMDCINHGVLAMSAALINTQAERYDDVMVYLTGGDAPQLVPYIKAECIYMPNMVMDGLALGVKEN